MPSVQHTVWLGNEFVNVSLGIFIANADGNTTFPYSFVLQPTEYSLPYHGNYQMTRITLQGRQEIGTFNGTGFAYASMIDPYDIVFMEVTSV